MSDEALITLGVAEFENLMETQGLENTVKGVLAIANDELDQEAIGGVPLTVENLKDGSHPILDKLDRYKSLAPEDRNIETEEILTLFTNVSDFGKYDPEKGNFSGLKAGTYSAARALPETVGGGYGATKGFAAGMYAQSFIPPVGLPGAIAKGIVIAVPTVAGAIAGALGFGKAEDLIIGEAAPVVPSLQPATNMGETAMMAGSLIAAPLSSVKNTTGALEFLGNFSNVASGKFAKVADEAFEVTAKNSGLSEKAFKMANDARIAAQAGPMFGANAQGVNIGLGRFNPAGYLIDPLKGPVSTRVLGAVEKGVSRSMAAARANPIPYLAIETASGLGGASGAYIAEATNPYDEKTRFLAELAGSFVVPLPVQAGVNVAPDLFSKVKQWWGKAENTDGLMTSAINRDSVNRIKNAIKLTGEKTLQPIDGSDASAMTPDEQFAAFFEELQKISVDADGNPVSLTFKDLAKDADLAAGTNFSPTVEVIQNELEKSSKDLAAATGRGREEMQAGAVNMIRTLAATGDPLALTVAARLQQGLFEQNIIDNMEESVTALMAAGVKVLGRDVVDAGTGAKVPSQRGKLSEDLYEILSTQVKQSKKRERQLWNEVKSFPLTEFYSRNGREISQPNVLQLLDRSSRTGGLNFSSVGAKKELKNALGGYQDDIDEMVEYFQNGTGRNPATAQKFFEMRSGLLNKASNLRKNGDVVNAGRLDKINDALLRDLTGQKNGASEAYNNARAYTFARNNVFRRSFLNDMQVTDKQRGLLLDPQELLDAMFKGNNLATVKRVKEIRAAGRFLVDQAGFSEEAVQTMETTDIINAALRDSLSKVMTVKQVPNPANPNETIERLVVSEAQLNRFREQPGTKELFKLLPELEGELASVEAAQDAFDNTLGNIANQVNPSKAKQRGFDDEQIKMLYDTKAFQSVIDAGEDPSEAVAKALASEKPVLALNSLFRMVNEANYKNTEYTKEMALSGLKSGIIQNALRNSERGSARLLPNGDVLQKELFGQIPGVAPNVKFSMEDFMIRKGLVDETVGDDGLTEMGRIQQAIKTMRGVEEAFATNNFENVLFKKPSLGKLFYARIFGATAGGAVQNKLKSLLGLPQMSGGLIAEQTGSELVQRFFLKGPESQRIKKMTELFANPAMLSALMNENITKSAQDKSMSVLERFISPLARQVGRRVPYGITAGEKAFSEEIDYIAPEQETVPLPPSDQQGSLNTVPAGPPTQNGPVTQPSPVQQAAAPPPVAPVQSSGPVDRTRYAALFPNDSATQLMKSGIGSLGA